MLLGLLTDFLKKKYIQKPDFRNRIYENPLFQKQQPFQHIHDFLNNRFVSMSNPEFYSDAGNYVYTIFKKA